MMKTGWLIQLLLIVPPSLAQHRHDHSALVDVQQLHIAPQCWLQAIQSLDISNDDVETESSLGRSLCAQMTPNDQKRLALEMTKCHLADLGRESVTAPCSDLGCLRQLTDHGLQAYTHFVTHVYAVCSRLTLDLAVHHQQTVSRQLTKVSREAVDSLDVMVQQQQELYHAAQERELQALAYQLSLTNDISKQHAVLDQQRLKLSMYQVDFQTTMMETQQGLHDVMKLQDDAMKEQANMMHDRMHQVLQHVEQRETEQHLQMKEWWATQQTALQQQMVELERQRERLAELHRAASVVSTIMTPFLVMEWWIGMARSIISVILQLPFPVLLFVVVYLLTIPKRTGRRRFMVLVFVELLLEAMFSDAVTMIRFWTKVLVASLYVHNLLFQAPIPNKMQQTMMEWKMELEAQQRRDTVEREARWMELLEKQTQLADDVQREARFVHMLEHQPKFPLVPVTMTQQQKQQHALTPTLVTTVTPNKPELTHSHPTLQNAPMAEPRTDKKRSFEDADSGNRDDDLEGPPKKRQACM